MYFFYLIALVPSIIGLVLFLTSDKVNWKEWVGITASAFVVSGFMHSMVILDMTGDEEFWSGKIVSVKHCPAWTEEYKKTHTRTVDDGDGKSHTETYTTTEHDYHREYWECVSDYGMKQTDIRIDLHKYNEIVRNFGGGVDETGKQEYNHGGKRDAGDDRYYLTRNKTHFMYATNEKFHFENRVRSCPSTFSFLKVPTNIPVFHYPEYKDVWQSNRLIGRAKTDFNIGDFDKLNSRLGANKKANVILVGFDEQDESIAEYQKAEFIGGKKNDLVICYGYIGGKLSWVNVFGWTEQEIVKENIRSIMMKTQFKDLIPAIEKEIILNYELVNWSKFDYLKVQPKMIHFAWLMLLMIVTQSGLWWWVLSNDIDRDDRY
jgi:hypothetical protein